MGMKKAFMAALGVAAVMFVAVAGTSSAQPTRAGSAEAPVRTMATDGASFLEVNTAGQLVRWTRTDDGSTFQREVRGTGWQTARLVTSLSEDKFIEIKADGSLAEWNWIDGIYQQKIRGTGWDGSRAIAGLDAEHFVEIKPDNRLALWSWTANGYQQLIVGSGWGTARLIG